MVLPVFWSAKGTGRAQRVQSMAIRWLSLLVINRPLVVDDIEISQFHAFLLLFGASMIHEFRSPNVSANSFLCPRYCGRTCHSVSGCSSYRISRHSWWNLTGRLLAVVFRFWQMLQDSERLDAGDQNSALTNVVRCFSTWVKRTEKQSKRVHIESLVNDYPVWLIKDVAFKDAAIFTLIFWARHPSMIWWVANLTQAGPMIARVSVRDSPKAEMPGSCAVLWLLGWSFFGSG